MSTTPKTRERANAETLADRIYHEIQDRVLYREWGDGHHALEQEIAEELGVSRTPVREALSRLQSDGLIKVIPRHGFQVLPMSPRDVRETYQIFTRLESLAVELAASRRPSPAQLEPLEQTNREMAIAYESSDFKSWTRADEAFHYHLVELSGNRILNEVHKNFWGRMQRARLTMLSLIKPPAGSTQEHAKIIDAIRHGNSALACERLDTHFGHIIAYVNNLKEPRLGGSF